MLSISKLKSVIESHKALRSIVTRVAVFKGASLVVDLSYRDVVVGLDVSVEEGGWVAIFPRNDIGRYFLAYLLNADFNIEPRHCLYKNGKPFSAIMEEGIPSGLSDSIDIFLIKLCSFLKSKIEAYVRSDVASHNSFLILESSKEIEGRLSELLESRNLLHASDFFRGRIRSMKETLDLIHEKRLSLARFGDGELKLLARLGGKIVFQENSFELNAMLKDLLSTPIEGLLVAIPPLLFENSFWRRFWVDYWSSISYNFQLPDYANSMVTRPEFFRTFGREGGLLWKRLWYRKRICFITGSRSRLNLKHEIFEGASSCEVVFSSPVNAFSEVAEIKRRVQSGSKADIYLIALGPAGTVLASELHQMGLWALDVGHISNSYDHVIIGTESPESLSFK